MLQAMKNKAMGMAMLVSMTVGCATEPPTSEESFEVQESDDDRAVIFIVDSITGLPLENMLVCTQHYPAHCDTTNAWGQARLERLDEAVELTYLGLYYRVHRAPIRQSMWRENDAFILPAVSIRAAANALTDAGVSEDAFTGLVLVPNDNNMSATLAPESGDGPVEGLGDWSIFANVEKGITDVLFEGNDGLCSARLAPDTEGATRVTVASGIVTVVTDVTCE